MPYGTTRSATGTLDTDKLFTGQRLDDTGLYYYNARYYDATIGRFISADTIVPNYKNPQTLNRYSYCLNNPLKYVDPSGHNGFTDWWSDRWHDVCDNVGDWWNGVTASYSLLVNHDQESLDNYHEAMFRLWTPRSLEENLEQGGTFTIGLQGSFFSFWGGSCGGAEVSISLKDGYKYRFDTWRYAGEAKSSDFGINFGPYYIQTDARDISYLDPDNQAMSLWSGSINYPYFIGVGLNYGNVQGHGYAGKYYGISIDGTLIPVSYLKYPDSWSQSRSQPGIGAGAGSQT